MKISKDAISVGSARMKIRARPSAIGHAGTKIALGSAVAIAVMTSMPLHAQLLSSAAPETPVVLLHASDFYRIETDGRFTDTVDVVKQIKTAKGIQESAQKQIAYSDSLQAIDVLEAYTETPDGKKIPVAKDKILTQESPVSANAPMFSDYKIKVIVFPQVEVGSKLHYRYVRTQKTPLFPGEFSTIEEYPLDQQIDEAKLTVIAAKSLTLRVQAVGMQGGVTDCSAADKGKQCYVWTMTNPIMQPPEPFSVSSLDYSPRVAISTFKDYPSVAAAYETRAADKSKVTPKIKELADSLTKGIDDKNKQAEALYNWVSKNIRYVAVYLGTGGVVPHDADTVLANRYGDCKDHVALLQALLAAKGIDSSGALVNLGTTYWLPDVATAPGVFNHIITYIPAMNRYVDSTLQFARFGDLAANEVGKPVLMTRNVSGIKQVATLPLQGAMPTATHVVVKMQTSADGSVSGTAAINDSGSGEIADRAIMAGLPVGQDEAISARILASSGETGSGSFDKGDPHDLDKPYAYGMSFKLPNYISLPGPGAFVFPTGLHGFLGIDGIAVVTAVEKRKFPLAGIAGFAKHEDYTLELPTGLKVTSLPKNVDLKTTVGEYESVYTLKGRTLHVVRDMRTTIHGATCSPEQYLQLREFAQEIGKDLRAQVMYQ
jgi:transglutaminase-like putative cysteine protease